MIHTCSYNQVISTARSRYQIYRENPCNSPLLVKWNIRIGKNVYSTISQTVLVYSVTLFHQWFKNNLVYLNNRLSRINKLLLHKCSYCFKTGMNLMADASSLVKKKHILKTPKIHVEMGLVQQKIVRSQLFFKRTHLSILADFSSATLQTVHFCVPFLPQ